jgi:hypothetical protein
MISFITPLSVSDTFRRRNWKACHANLIDIVREVGGEWIVPERINSYGKHGHRDGCTQITVDEPFNRSRFRNIGAAAAKFDRLCFIDLDMVMHPEAWRIAIDRSQKYDAYSPCHLVYYLSKQQTANRLDDRFSFKWDFPLPKNTARNANLMGGIAFIDKAMLESIGRWDEHFMGWGSEDSALSLLAMHAGRTHIEEMVAFHMYHPIRRVIKNRERRSAVRIYQRFYRPKVIERALEVRKLDVTGFGPKRLYSLDYHIADECNLSCAYCNHYSNFHRSKTLKTLEQATAEWSDWSSQIIPEELMLLGGEPTVNPELPEIIEAAKEFWPFSRINLFSNGFKLKSHPGLASALVGCRLILSMHRGPENETRNRRIGRGFASMGIDVELRDVNSNWRRFYQVDENGKEMPFSDDQQRKSWETCASKKCHVLKDGKLYKCPQTAFAADAGIDFEHFKTYDACSPGDDIEAWLAREDEPCCSHCPATPSMVNIEPLKRVKGLLS